MIKLFHSRPKSLGEGLKRVVAKAGNGEEAKLVSAKPGERVYSNGVNIYSTDNLTCPANENGIYYSAVFVSKGTVGKYKENKLEDLYAVKGRKALLVPTAIEGMKELAGVQVDKAVGSKEKVVMHFKNTETPFKFAYSDRNFFKFNIKKEYNDRI